ncbi:MAG: 50S ribosomal protein L5 [Minisyncoccales bacterium]
MFNDNMRLREKIEKEVKPLMKEKFHYKNLMQVPRIEKIVVNVGFGRLVVEKTKEEQEKIKNEIAKILSQITGQRPVFCLTKKAISAFKTKKGMVIGAKVTLRKQRMFDFLEKIINIVLPRLRDFKGLDEKSFDKHGNFSFGIRELIVFPEILPEEVKFSFGLEITISLRGQKNKKEAIEFLKLINLPFKK